MLESVTDFAGILWQLSSSLVLYIMLFFTKTFTNICSARSTLTVTAIVRRYVTRIYFKGLTYKDEREGLHQ